MQLTDRVKNAIQNKLNEHYSISNFQRLRHPKDASIAHYILKLEQNLELLKDSYIGPKHHKEDELLEIIREITAIGTAAMINYGCGSYKETE